MKKLLLGFIFSLVISYSASAQNFDLEFDYSINNVTSDTLVMGKSYGVEALMFNKGPGDFSDFLDFRVFVGNTASGFNPAITKESFKLNNTKFFGIPLYGAESAYGQMDISPLHFKENSYNIVIIWPTDSYRDQNNKNDYKVMKFYVKSAEIRPDSKAMIRNNPGLNEYNASLNTTEGTSKLNFYPNPATSVLNVYLNNTETGTLKITDINGKEIHKIVLGTNQNSAFVPVQLTKDGSALPNGIYLISLETGSYCEVKKFVVFK